MQLTMAPALVNARSLSSLLTKAMKWRIVPLSRYSPSLSRNRRHEVFAAATAATAEAAEVGEQRRRIHGRYSQSDVGIWHAGTTQSLVNVVINTGARLSFAVHRHVRLDACVPTCIDAAPGRLLRLALTSMDRARSERRGRESKRERERKSVSIESYTLTISD